MNETTLSIQDLARRVSALFRRADVRDPIDEERLFVLHGHSPETVVIKTSSFPDAEYGRIIRNVRVDGTMIRHAIWRYRGGKNGVHAVGHRSGPEGTIHLFPLDASTPLLLHFMGHTPDGQMIPEEGFRAEYSDGDLVVLDEDGYRDIARARGLNA